MFATLILGKGPEDVDEVVVDDSEVVVSVLSVLLLLLGDVPNVEVTVTVAVSVWVWIWVLVGITSGGSASEGLTIERVTDPIPRTDNMTPSVRPILRKFLLEFSFVSVDVFAGGVSLPSFSCGIVSPAHGVLQQ